MSDSKAADTLSAASTLSNLSQNEKGGRWEQVGAGPADVSKTARTILQQIRPWFDQVSESDRQQALRERYPALQTAWDNYLMVLRMVENEHSPDDADESNGVMQASQDMSATKQYASASKQRVTYTADDSTDAMVFKHHPETT